MLSSRDSAWRRAENSSCISRQLVRVMAEPMSTVLNRNALASPM
jgi:hypothetical protein